jgi:hypothetical protein
MTTVKMRLGGLIATMKINRKAIAKLSWGNHLFDAPRILLLIIVMLLGWGVSALIFPSTTEACANAQSCSSNYEVNEVFFGNGGGYGYGAGSSSTCSTNYCADETVGETGVGNIASINYQAQAGFNTFRSPSLSFIVNAANINLGVLTPTSTATATTTFAVQTYLASGYTITTGSLPPQNGSYPMHTPGSAASSTQGTEQFGINLVANTSPATLSGVSASPTCALSGFCNMSTVSVGANYNQPNKYYYPSSGNDTLVTVNSSNGLIDYTVSYIFNVSVLTPGGTYTFNQVLVATSTF